MGFFCLQNTAVCCLFAAMSNNSPIGIFDSGIGGLTVASAIRNVLPHESIVYFGDTAHMPYGEKDQEDIQEYAVSITSYLLQEKHCKAIVIACNTASAAAYETLRDKYKGVVPIINVIDPMIEAVIQDDEVNKVGIIATRTTIRSGVYQSKFARRKPSLHYSALATPLLATMIEEGFYNNNVSTAVLNNYLSNPILSGIDGLVLGCTHYPLIKDEIMKYYDGKIKIFDSAQVVAHKLKQIMQKENLLAETKSQEDHFLVSESSESFEESARIFFSQKIKLQTVPLWGPDLSERENQ